MATKNNTHDSLQQDVSHRWYYSLHHLDALNFDDTTAMGEILNDTMRKNEVDYSLLNFKRQSFVNNVTIFLYTHQGSVIDQFKVAFYLDDNNQTDIDQWIVLALSKQVKKLELDFNPPFEVECWRYQLHQYLIDCCFSTLNMKPLLTSLCLKNVKIATHVMDHLLAYCCLTLENLSIENFELLETITGTCPSLKFLKVSGGCANFQSIDIDAPKLVSFTYDGVALRILNIANSSLLSHVSVGYTDSSIAPAVESLFKYFPHLECLKLEFSLLKDINLGINSCPILTHLKELQLGVVSAHSCQSLLGWVPLFEACPLLEKLTLDVQEENDYSYEPAMPFEQDMNDRQRHPFQNLKTLEIIGFAGCQMDLEVANFVLDNCLVLQEVIVRATYSIRPQNSLELADKLHLPPKINFYFFDGKGIGTLIWGDSPHAPVPNTTTKKTFRPNVSW